MYENYKNSNGTYTSPKNGKTYRSLKAFIAHWHVKPRTGGWIVANGSSKKCKFCDTEKSNSNISKHEASCYLNPTNLRECHVCKSPIKDYKNSKGTCSHSCSNTFFRHARNKIDNYKNYVTICFHFHKKECVVCKENKIVAVHHYNEDHNDNRPENLVPLCPTHHSYVHSRYYSEIKNVIDNYVDNCIKRQSL